MAEDGLPGVDLERLKTFLDDVKPGLIQAQLQASLIAGGKSNLTCTLTDGHSEWVLRRPPLGHVLATAHDMHREYRVLTALGSSDVPVPLTIVECTDTDVLGAPFYVMEKVAGHTYRLSRDLLPLGDDRVCTISTKMVDTLATLHAVDPAAVGLADFGKAEGFLARQVSRWRKQLDCSRSRAIPGIEELHESLEKLVPAESEASIVHGDYRLDNLLIDDDDNVAALLDWEMSTLGDPLTDVALIVAYAELATMPGGRAVADAASAPGFLSADDMLARYADLSGRDVSKIGFYVAFTYFKTAVIAEGIHYRFTQGKTVGAGFEAAGIMVEPLVSAGLAALGQIPSHRSTVKEI